jgi:hypothetical protein
MKVQAVPPNIDTAALLAGAQFSDAFRITVDGTTLDARRAAEKMLARGPRWIASLLALRNRMVAPFGLKTLLPGGSKPIDSVGIVFLRLRPPCWVSLSDV